MHLRIETTALADALASVAKAADEGAHIPALAGIRLTLTGAELALEATDLELTLRTRVSCQGLEDGEVVAPARTLLASLKGRKSGVAELTTAVEELHVKVERSVSKLPLLRPEQWPVPREPEHPLTFTPTGGAVPKTLSSWCSKNTSRPAINGVLLEADPEGHLNVVATDTYRLLAVAIPGTFDREPVERETETPDKRSSVRHYERCTVPAKAFDTHLGPTLGVHPVSLSPRLVDHAHDGQRFTSTLVADLFPSWRLLLRTYGGAPEDPLRIPDPDELERTLARHLSFHEENESTLTGRTLLEADGEGTLVLTSTSKRWGTISDELAADGPAQRTVHNTGFAIDLVRLAKGQEEMVVNLDPKKPTVYHGQGMRAVLMPVVGPA